jgi:hypothetical protein
VPLFRAVGLPGGAGLLTGLVCQRDGLERVGLLEQHAAGHDHVSAQAISASLKSSVLRLTNRSPMIAATSLSASEES